MKIITITVLSLLLSNAVYGACPCTNPAAPLCSQNSCYPCRADTDCISISGKPYCSNAVCRSCNEYTNQGCNSNLPYCLNGLCTACSNNSTYCQLADKNANLSSISHIFCTGNVCSSSWCQQNTDCLLPDFPVCNLTTGACSSECTDDSNCTNFANFPICIAGKCQSCYVDTDCPSGTICSRTGSTQYQCVVCETETSRGCMDASSPYCFQNSDGVASCSRCLLDSDCAKNIFINSIGLTICTHANLCSSPNYGNLCSSSNPCTDLAASWCLTWPATGNMQCYYCYYNETCSTSFPNTPYCFNGSCVSCLDSDTCSSASAPRCDLTLLQCTNCIANADCSRFFPKITCEYGDPTDLTSYQCVQCLYDSDCNKNYTDGSCQNSTSTCVGLTACTTSNDCTSIIRPVCDGVTGYCMRCQTNSDCSNFPNTLYCNITNTDNNTCVQCVMDSDCDNTRGLVCSSDNTCVIKTCTTNSDCISAVPECLNQSFCVRCSNDTECKTWYNDVGYYCNTTNGSCMLSPNPCYEPNQCSNPALAYCNTGICQACQENSECGFYNSSLAFCIANVCRECRTTQNCTDPNFPVCLGNACVGCSNNTNCAKFSTQIYCNPNTNQCQECLSNTDCFQLNNSRCDITTGTCAPCQTASDCTRFPQIYQCRNDSAPATCSNCVTDSDCPLEFTNGTCSNYVCSEQSNGCLYSGDCDTTIYPVCDASGFCRRCTSNEDCAPTHQFPTCYEPSDGRNICVECVTTADCDVSSNQTCDTNTFLCVGIPCNTSSQCTGTGKPQCVYNNCVPCRYDSECHIWYLNNILACNTTTNSCYVPTPICTANSDCNISYPYCTSFSIASTDHCSYCTTNAQCSAFNTSTPFCFITLSQSTCVECDPSYGYLCTNPARALCDSTYTCVPCSADFECDSLSPSLPRCISGVCYACSNDTDCTDPSASHCSTTTWSCTSCLSNGDCTQFSGKPYCISGVCQQCRNNSDCTSPSSSKCVSNTCSPCLANSDCTQIANAPTCQPILNSSSGLNQCYECSSNSDCLPSFTANVCQSNKTCLNDSPSCTSNSSCNSNTYPYCNTTARRCRRCESDQECSSKFGSSKSYCRLLDGLSVCTQCRTGLDCPSGQICNSQGSCTPFFCSSKAACLSNDPTLPECYNHKCVVCTSKSMCQSLNGNSVMYACNSTTGACYNGGAHCDSINDCTDPSFAACISGICSPCTEDSDCLHIGTGNLRSCRLDLGSECTECLLPIDCIEPSAPTCLANGTCVPCRSNSDCQYIFAAKGKPFCFNGTNSCVQCVSNSSCTDASLSFCNPASQQCVACLSNSDCSNPQLSVCDSNGNCSICKTSSDCNAFSSTRKTFCTPSGCAECTNGGSTCTSCPYGYYLNKTDQSCRPKIPVSQTLIEDQPPLQYNVSFNYSFDSTNLPFTTQNIQLYSSNNAVFTFKIISSRLPSQILALGLLSYSESPTSELLEVSFTQWNLDLYEIHMIVPENSSIAFPNDDKLIQNAKIIGLTAQTAVITTSAVSFLSYLNSKGYSSYLLRFLILMSQLNFLKLININFSTSLALFFEAIDLSQFGMPNFLKTLFKVPDDGSSTDSTLRILQASDNTTMNNSVIFNTYQSFSFGTIFLDTYGGILVGSIGMLLLYLLSWGIFCLLKEKRFPRTKKILRALLEMMENNVLTTLLMSRYQYLILAIFLNYMYRPLSNAYEITSFAITSIYTVIIVLGIIGCIRAIPKQGKWEKKSAVMRYVVRKINVLFLDYEDTALGRTIPAVILIYNMVTMAIIALLQNWPAVQILLMLTNNIVAITLFCGENIFKSMYIKFVAIVSEVGLFLMGLCLLWIYALQFDTTTKSYNTRVILGWVGVSIAGTTIFLSVATKLFEVIVLAIKKFREKKKKRAENASNERRKSKQQQFGLTAAENKDRSMNEYGGVENDPEHYEADAINPVRENPHFETRVGFLNDSMNSSQINLFQSSNSNSPQKSLPHQLDSEDFKKQQELKRKSLKKKFQKKQLDKQERRKNIVKKVTFLNNTPIGGLGN